MTKLPLFLLAALTGASVLMSAAATAADAGAQTVRPAGYRPMAGDAKLGAQLFSDQKLSTNGLSCASCHANRAAYADSFARPYPHAVAMARDQLGRKQVHLDEMIQACLVMPMAAKPLPWDSKELAALTAFVAEEQKAFKPAKR